MRGRLAGSPLRLIARDPARPLAEQVRSAVALIPAIGADRWCADGCGARSQADLGASGRALARVARGFGMEVIAIRRQPAPASSAWRGVGLDVYWEEPPDPSDPLLPLDNVVATPQPGGITEEALVRIADRLVTILREQRLGAAR